ncbi:MAG: CoA-binding protein [Candidatus Kerfeldbacteria bacterium]
MKTVAIIGASADRKKFGNKSVRAHQKQGWKVFPVNPKAVKIEELDSYQSILDIKESVNRVSIYLHPEQGIKILNDIAKIKPDEVFVNPGASSEELLNKAKKLNLNIIEACSIVDVGEQPINYY